MMKRAIIIGASSGMGREVARILLAEGWRIGVAARRTAPLRELEIANPKQVVSADIDVNDEEAPAKLLSLIERLGGIDLYFHAAGVGWQNPQLDLTVELDTVRTNGMGFTRLVDTAFGYMATHGGGHIAVISSIAGTKGLGPAPAYSATKAFQNTYIQALEQLANARRLPIRFTDIRPGFVDTPLLAGGHYPMLMSSTAVARQIVRAVNRRRHVRVIDWRYRVLVFFWRLIPNVVWRRLTLTRS